MDDPESRLETTQTGNVAIFGEEGRGKERRDERNEQKEDRATLSEVA